LANPDYTDELAPALWVRPIEGEEEGSLHPCAKGDPGGFPVYEIPDGYALVPIEPTKAMVEAAFVLTGYRTTSEDIWKEMIAARPDR
jgi:hypothetical protein